MKSHLLKTVGLQSRNKGKAAERDVVALAGEYGLEARRSWETAQSPDATARKCDVLLAGQPCQVKLSRGGFKGLYAALEGVAIAFLRADRKPWLVAVRATNLFGLLQRLNNTGD